MIDYYYVIDYDRLLLRHRVIDYYYVIDYDRLLLRQSDRLLLRHKL